jgi:hypothetical protein
MLMFAYLRTTSNTQTPRLLALVILSLLLLRPPAPAAVVAGALTIVGYDDYADDFSLVVLEPISAGEVIYFTNNGWSNASGSFNGAGAHQGAGLEALLKLTVNTALTPGSILSTTHSTTEWSWTTSGLIPGQSTQGLAQFSKLTLDYESDQIYAFQAAELNPLLHPTSFIHAVHMGSAQHPTFSDAVDTQTGATPTSLAAISGGAVVLSPGQHGDADGVNSEWGVDLDSTQISALQSSGASAEEWRQALATGSAWASGTDQVNIPGVSLNVVPEPNRVMLFTIGLLTMILQRQRKRNICDNT